MAEKLREDFDIDVADLGIKRILLGDEPGGSIPEVRDRLSNVWAGAEIYDGIRRHAHKFFRVLDMQTQHRSALARR